MKTGEQLMIEGMDQSINNADEQIESWSAIAYRFLCGYARRNKEFLAEDVRIASKEIVPIPPSNRAWGGVMANGSKQNIIKSVGYRKVKNPKAHCTPATLWRSSIY